MDDSSFPTVAWRYLLPGPPDGDGSGFPPLRDGGLRFRRAIVAGDAVLVGHVDEVAAEVVEAAGPGSKAEADVDLVVCGEPTGSDLERLADRLSPGGRLVAEFQPPKWRSAWSFARLVASSGLRVNEVYSVNYSEDHAKPSFWLPLTPVGPGRYLRGQLQLDNDRDRRLQTLDRILAAVGRILPKPVFGRGWTLFPRRGWGVVVIASHRIDASDGVERVEGPSYGDRHRLLRIGGSAADQPIVYHFGADVDGPDAISKIASTERDRQCAEVEIGALTGLLASNPELGSTPRILDEWSAPGLRGQTQTVFPGAMLSTWLGARGFERTIDELGRWLTELAVATRTTGQTVAETADRWLTEIERVVDKDHPARSMVAASRRSLPSLTVDTRVLQHGDLAPWNVMATNKTFGVIDWANTVPDGLPLLDLTFFATHAAAQLGGGYGRELEPTIRALHDPTSERGRVVETVRRRYGDALGLTEQDRLVLPQLAWIYRAHRNFVRGSKAEVFCRLWQLELDRVEQGLDRPS